MDESPASPCSDEQGYTEHRFTRTNLARGRVEVSLHVVDFDERDAGVAG